MYKITFVHLNLLGYAQNRRKQILSNWFTIIYVYTFIIIMYVPQGIGLLSKYDLFLE